MVRVYKFRLPILELFLAEESRVFRQSIKRCPTEIQTAFFALSLNECDDSKILSVCAKASVFKHELV